ncbi:DUF4411 family protein [Candidatus Poribacteria bacterium]|nr:DUF4411 family protein [Candidatus Poribacteria bacterium]
MKYSIDTSALLDGWNRHYPPDVFPQVWTRIDELIDSGVLIATEEVLVELEKKDDAVYAWARERSQMFVPTNEDVQRAVTDILRDHKKIIDQRKGRSGADPFVIALAKIEGCSVLTGERPGRSPAMRPHIPDVCNALGIPWFNLLQLFRQQKWILG